MAKITDLAVVDAINGDEFLPIVQAGATKRATMAALRALIVPYLQFWYKGDRGDPGAAGNVAATIAQLRAAPTTYGTMIAAYDGSGVTLTWTPGDFTSHAARYPGVYIKSDHAPLTMGAWVRQSATTLSLPGAPGIVSQMSEIFADARRAKAYFGAKGDGRRVLKPDGTPDHANFVGTDDTRALKDAIGEALDKGYELTLDRSIYLVSDVLSAQIGTGELQPRIRGAGRSLTEIVQIDKSKDALHITGNMPRRDYFDLSDLTVTYPDNWVLGMPQGRAITIENVRSGSIRRVRTFRSAMGLNLVGCLDWEIDTYTSYYDRQGGRLERGEYESFPNAIAIRRSEFQAALKYGLEIIGGCSVSMTGSCTIEHTGVENLDPAAAPFGMIGPLGRSAGLVVTDAGQAGGIAIHAPNLYLEGNRDFNIYINHGACAASYSFPVCGHNRFSDIRVVNDIVFDCRLTPQESALCPATLDVSGSIFKGFNGYVPDANKPAIAFTMPNGFTGLHLVQDGTLYVEAVERPRPPLMAVTSKTTTLEVFSINGSIEPSPRPLGLAGRGAVGRVATGFYAVYPVGGDVRNMYPHLTLENSGGVVRGTVTRSTNGSHFLVELFNAQNAPADGTWSLTATGPV